MIASTVHGTLEETRITLEPNDGGTIQAVTITIRIHDPGDDAIAALAALTGSQIAALISRGEKP